MTRRAQGGDHPRCNVIATFWRLALLCVTCFVLSPVNARAADYGHFGWEQVVPDVWYGTTLPDSFQSGNVVIVALPSGGALVVDSHNSDFLAREIIQKVADLGIGPVRYLVNTHLHQDHVGGNAAFRESFPRLQIIAHRNTCLGVPQKTAPRMEERLGPMKQQLEQLRAKRNAISESNAET